LSEAAYQVSVRNSKQHQCGGALISAKNVLTAAHCTILNQPRDLTIRLGSPDRERGGELVRVKNIFIHPKYNPETYNYDFSVIEMMKNVELVNGKKEIIKLPTTNDPIADGTFTLVSGWGRTKSDYTLSNDLRGVVVPIYNQNKCKKVYSDLTDKMICAGFDEGGKDSCQGETYLFLGTKIFLDILNEFQVILEVSLEKCS
jgi:trypsin